MANFPVQITTSCTLNPQQVPPLGGTTKCQLNSTVTYTNSNSGEVILSFVTASGSPFQEAPPYKVTGNGGTKTYTIGVNPAAQTSYAYALSCNAAAAGIIIVDGSGGVGPTPPRPGTAKKAAKKKKKTSSGTRGKKAKAGSKRSGGGTRKKSEAKTKKTSRRKRK